MIFTVTKAKTIKNLLIHSKTVYNNQKELLSITSITIKTYNTSIYLFYLFIFLFIYLFFLFVFFLYSLIIFC